MLRLTDESANPRFSVVSSGNLRQSRHEPRIGRRNEMIAKDRGRRARACVVGLTLLGGAATATGFGSGAASDGQAGSGSARTPKPKVRLDQIDVPGLKQTAIPVNPTDAIAIMNGQIISRQQLADECVARKGKEILDTLINRDLVDQALKAQEARNHSRRDRRRDRQRRRPVRHWPRGLVADARQGARDQPAAVRPRHHLSRSGPAKLVRAASRSPTRT